MDPHRLQVLVVSADADVLADVADQLGELGVGADLHHAEDVDGGLAEAREGVLDLLLLDEELPEDGADELLTTLRNDDALHGLTVVALSPGGEVPEHFAEHRIHDILSRRPTAAELGPVLSYLDEA